MTRLSLPRLAGLDREVARPAYDVAAALVGIVHLSVGAFHRAHQAVYLDDRRAAGETGWAITRASLRSADTQEALGPQDGLYTVATRGPEGEALRVMGALRRLLVAPRNLQALLAAMCDPTVRIVTLTVTEKGYCYDPASRRLQEDHPDIRHDLASRNRREARAASASSRRRGGAPAAWLPSWC